MPKIHFLNVGRGDCSIIEHGSGRVSMIDISCGNRSEPETKLGKSLQAYSLPGRLTGDFGMRHCPTNPLLYCKNHKIQNIFRFILSHPDMDHMDGLSKLLSTLHIQNFWHPGIKKIKPDFSHGGFLEEDWDCYQKVVTGKYPYLTVLSNLAESEFQFANKGGPKDQGDCLDIIAPNKCLLTEANKSGDCNEASYVIVYRSCGGKIIFSGDAHDATWDYIIRNHPDLVKNCNILIAPHHGRKSGRNYKFLDILKPKLTLFGCAPSEHLAYDALNYRGLKYITNNQAGNIILEANPDGIDVFVENPEYAKTYKSFNPLRVSYECIYIGTIFKNDSLTAVA